MAFADFEVPNSGSPYRDLGELKHDQILHLPTGLIVNKTQLLDVISHSRVIYLGETHDNLEAHRIQLEVIQGLQERFPGKLSVGMEMFRQSAQPELDAWLEGHLSQEAFNKVFYKNWGGGYRWYKDITDYLKKHHIPLIGLKSNRDVEARLRKDGTGAEGLPDMELNDTHHKASSLAIFGGHQSNPGMMLKPYHMLVLWEESMAERVADFLRDNAQNDKKMIVLAGGFHVQYGFGIPKRAFRRVPHPYSIILPAITEVTPETEGRQMDVEHVAIPLYAADFAWKVPYRLPPKKIKLGVFLEELAQGLRVKSVQDNSNAGRAGLVQGDVLLAMDGASLDSVMSLIQRLQKKKAGSSIALTVQRDDTILTIDVHLKSP